MDIYITGIGWVTADNMGCAGKVKAFRMTNDPLPKHIADNLLDSSHTASRRMDLYSKLGLAAIGFAMQDAGLDAWSQKRNIGIVSTSLLGCLNTDIEYFDTVLPQAGIGASPALFSYTLPSVYLGEAAICFGLTGNTYTINDKDPSGLRVVETACDHIGIGETDTMICGVCEPDQPPRFKQIQKRFSGALFFVIQRKPDLERYYGKLACRPDRIEFNQHIVNDLDQLVQLCLHSTGR